MDKTDMIIEAALRSIAEKAIENREVELQIIQELGLANSFFRTSLFGEGVRVAEISKESYLIAKTINPKFIFNDLDGSSQKKIIFSTMLKDSIIPGKHKFMILEMPIKELRSRKSEVSTRDSKSQRLDSKGKFVLVHKYSNQEDVGLIHTYKPYTEDKNIIRKLENKIEDLNDDIRDLRHEVKDLKRRIEDLYRDRKY